MKILPIVLAAISVAASPLAAAAADVAPVQEIVFSYDMKSELLANPAGVEAVYADLERRARAACAFHGVRGLQAVDMACAADLVQKVIVASGSAALEQHYAAKTGADAIEIASR